MCRKAHHDTWQESSTSRADCPTLPVLHSVPGPPTELNFIGRRWWEGILDVRSKCFWQESKGGTFSNTFCKTFPALQRHVQHLIHQIYTHTFFKRAQNHYSNSRVWTWHLGGELYKRPRVTAPPILETVSLVNHVRGSASVAEKNPISIKYWQWWWGMEKGK